LRHGAPTKSSTAGVLNKHVRQLAAEESSQSRNLCFVTLTAMANTRQYMTPFVLEL